MAYELYMLPVPDGGDVEDSAEALLALLVGGQLPTADGDDARAGELADYVGGLDEALERAEAQPGAAPGLRFRTPWELELEVTARFVRFRIPFTRRGDEARAAFDSVFELAGAIGGRTGWKFYDPQDASAVTADDRGRDATLEIYLSVMDQLDPGESFSDKFNEWLGFERGDARD